MEIQRICYKANLKVAKMYCIREDSLFDFFNKRNLGIIYDQAKIDNWLYWS